MFVTRATGQTLLKRRGVSAHWHDCNKARSRSGQKIRNRAGNMNSKFRFRLADVPVVLSFTAISLILLICLLSEVPLAAFVLLAALIFEVHRCWRLMLPPKPGAGISLSGIGT